MKFKRFVLFISIIVIFAGLYYFMNRNFDKLSRYPYDDDDEAKSLIIKYLDDDEINYIIEYAIDPSTFTDYIKSPNFSAYHTVFYQDASSYMYNLTPMEIVNVVEIMVKKDVNNEETYKKFAHNDYATIMYELESM